MVNSSNLFPPADIDSMKSVYHNGTLKCCLDIYKIIWLQIAFQELKVMKTTKYSIVLSLDKFLYQILLPYRCLENWKMQ